MVAALLADEDREMRFEERRRLRELREFAAEVEAQFARVDSRTIEREAEAYVAAGYAKGKGERRRKP